MIPVQLLQDKLDNVSADELRVAIPLLAVELNGLYNSLTDLVESLAKIKNILSEVVDDDLVYKREE